MIWYPIVMYEGSPHTGRTDMYRSANLLPSEFVNPNTGSEGVWTDMSSSTSQVWTGTHSFRWEAQGSGDHYVYPGEHQYLYGMQTRRRTDGNRLIMPYGYFHRFFWSCRVKDPLGSSQIVIPFVDVYDGDGGLIGRIEGSTCTTNNTLWNALNGANGDSSYENTFGESGEGVVPGFLVEGSSASDVLYFGDFYFSVPVLGIQPREAVDPIGTATVSWDPASSGARAIVKEILITNVSSSDSALTLKVLRGLADTGADEGGVSSSTAATAYGSVAVEARNIIDNMNVPAGAVVQVSLSEVLNLGNLLSGFQSVAGALSLRISGVVGI